MRIEIFQVDAFTDKVFHGNPAAVCILSEWLNDELLQAIAVENNYSETAFIIEKENSYSIRWFAPNGEISLCGHATLAAGFVLFELNKRIEPIVFKSLSGPLTVSKNKNRYTLDFPRLGYEKLNSVSALSSLVDKPIVEAYEGELDYLVLLEDEYSLQKAQVNLKGLVSVPKRGLILTSVSTDADFYVRCFYPKHNIAEDPVTGSAYCILAPFWSERLQKKTVYAIQGSFRKGQVFCEVLPTRVLISGHCRWYMKGMLVI